MKLIKIKKQDAASDFLVRQKWIDSIHKLSNQLESLTKKMPKGLAKSDKLSAEMEVEVLIRRADRLVVQIRKAEEIENIF